MESVTIREAKELLKNCVAEYMEKDEKGAYCLPQNKQRPVYLLGAAGIGKTEIAAQAARECGVGFVGCSLNHYTRQSAAGMPAIVTREYEGNSYQVTEYTMSEILEMVYERKRAGEQEGILFVDEINCISETMWPVMLQFLQNKSFGSCRLPEGWMIAAAGNPTEYNRSARDFDAVLCDRLRVIRIRPDMEAWMEYAEQLQMHSMVLAFVKSHPALFYVFEKSGKGQAIVTPRAWEDLSNALLSGERLGHTVTLPLVSQFLQHEQTAQSFYHYYDMQRRVLSREEEEAIFQGRADRKFCERVKEAGLETRWAVVWALRGTLESRAAKAAAILRKQELEEKEKKLADGLLVQWRDALTHFLEWIEETLGREGEMESVLSGLCRNLDTGYLLAVGGNPLYMRLCREMNLQTRENETSLRRQIRELEAKEKNGNESGSQPDYPAG